MMQRLAHYEIGEGVARPGLRLGAQLLFGGLCAMVMIALGNLVHVRVPTASPFVLIYPAVLLATLYGHWRAGGLALVLTFIWAWYAVLPFTDSFLLATSEEAWRGLLNAVSALVVMLLAESFRRAVRRAMAERDGEIDRRTMLLHELEHCTKNNFALVLSLLQTQKRRTNAAPVRQALERAAARIHSFASAYANLAASQGEGESVAMHPYLTDVVRRVTEGGFEDDVEVSVDIAECCLPRQAAVAIGLFTNEALTNCAKYAFPDGRPGTVEVTFACRDGSWDLVIADDGVGTSAEPTAGSGLGTRLLAAFARQARADWEIEATPHGRTLRLTSRSEKPARRRAV